MAVTWLDEDDVATALGLASPNTNADVTRVTAMVNHQAYRLRQAAGWTDTGWLDGGDPEAEDTVPNASVADAILQWAVLAYKQRNTTTSYIGVDEAIDQTYNQRREIRDLLQIRMPQVT